MALAPYIADASGVFYDFKYGCRVLVPSDWPRWRVVMRDLDSGDVIVDEEHDGAAASPGRPYTLVMSPQKYFVRWQLQVWRDGAQIIEHDFDAEGHPVLICTPNALGDCFTRMRAVLNFHKKHKPKTLVQMHDNLVPLFANHRDYDGIEFVGYIDDFLQHNAQFYAAYAIGVFYGVDSVVFGPYHHLNVSNVDLPAHMLGVPTDHRPPRINLPPKPEGLPKHYVTIAQQSTTRCKRWLYPGGWKILADWLRDKGYGVFSVDGERDDPWFHRLPAISEDYLGAPLADRAALIRNADFHIGSAGGLSWVAWSVGTPSVIICGFSAPGTEGPQYFSQYRVTNPHVCNSCWNNQSTGFDTSNFDWCPRWRGTPQAWECAKRITPTQVFSAIERLIEDKRKQ